MSLTDPVIVADALAAPSTAAAVVRRSLCPVVVCPRDPAAAMRLREALLMARTGRRR